MKNLTVGRIPSLTWNRLAMNEAQVDREVELNTTIEEHFETMPAGVTRKDLTQEEAGKWLASHAPEQAPEAVQAGKTPIYHPQTFATGLGADFDRFVADQGQKTTLLEVAAGTRVEEPLTWRVDFQDGNEALMSQLIHVQEGGSLTLILSYHSEAEAAGFAGVSTKVVLDAGASLHLVKVQLLGKGFTHLDDVGASLLENASMRMTQLELGGLDVHAGLQAELIGKASEFKGKNGYLGRENQNVDINYNMVLRGKKTSCDMTFDGVMDGQAKKRLSDTIDFRRGAKGAYGHEAENVLLLSNDVINQSLPVILCEEEDMEGTHGATIGQLDDDMLFYMASRGIDRKAAEQIMVRARLTAVARDIPNEDLKKEIHDYIEEAFR